METKTVVTTLLVFFVLGAHDHKDSIWPVI